MYGFKLSLLILVLMEYKNTDNGRICSYERKCLNPCSNGIQKYKGEGENDGERVEVLILVLMEYKNTIFLGWGFGVLAAS